MIAHAIPGLGRSQGGPSYSVPRLCAALSHAGANVELLTVEQSGDSIFTGVDARLCKQDLRDFPVIGKLRISRDFARHVRTAAQKAAIVHVHGLWLMPNVDAGHAARRAGKPLVVSPRGMLAREALRISRRRKAVFWKLLQGEAYAGAALWHATSDAEAEDIRAFGIQAPIAVVPNGIDVPAETLPRSAEAMKAPALLYLGRIHPKKNLTSLVEAWSAVAPNFPEWRLRIVGPDEGGHAAELKALASRLMATRISIEAPVYGEAKKELLADASIFVLPTHNENFGIAVAEALASGVPTIVTKGAPWPGLRTENCGWWIDHGVQPLVEAMQNAMSLAPERRRAMGEAGRAWMTRDFSWASVAGGMWDAYAWVTGRGPKPSTLRLT